MLMHVELICLHLIEFNKDVKVNLSCKWYQSRPLPVRCGSRTNQARAGGHVTPKADEDGDWLRVHKARQ